MYKNKLVLSLLGLIHEAGLKGGYKVVAYKMVLNGCTLTPTACLTGGGSLAEQVG